MHVLFKLYRLLYHYIFILVNITFILFNYTFYLLCRLLIKCTVYLKSLGIHQNMLLKWKEKISNNFIINNKNLIETKQTSNIRMVASALLIRKIIFIS